MTDYMKLAEIFNEKHNNILSKKALKYLAVLFKLLERHTYYTIVKMIDGYRYTGMTKEGRIPIDLLINIFASKGKLKNIDFLTGDEIGPE